MGSEATDRENPIDIDGTPLLDPTTGDPKASYADVS